MGQLLREYQLHRFVLLSIRNNLCVNGLLEKKPALVWDLGGNTGVFSREAASSGAFIVSFDIDPAAVEQNYRTVKTKKEQNILPLVLDLNQSKPCAWLGQ